MRDLHERLELAAALGVGGVRNFPSADPGNGKAKDWDETAGRRLSAAAEVASSLNVQLLLETHDSHPTGTDIARILRLVEPSGTTKAIWDVLHPWRHGEQPENTANAVRGSLAYCQFIDAIIGAGPDSVTLTLPGQGAIPISAIAGMAEKISKNQGDETFWACPKWEKAWHPHLAELPEALTALRAILMPMATS
ncbi:sugar phosphate isomerase/epimerase [Pseudarthrobacter sp. NamE5]|uniref:sugar phosphate isomerase/epimerase family protein n=1 Tax=Pseudarthrobacter sp. NamE5 TaxID=2576839 RepID=UPI00110B7A71|nr:TIM barrel protein [Pseudarthrobacter sp. NamE5]TLM88204.1 TIM barrel protein [Pseudarthrobacter sp. NamE5]